MNAGVHQYEDKLLDYAYGELPAHEAAAVDAHVRTCTKCSHALVQIRGVRSVFAPLPIEAAPEAGLASLLAYADHHARRAKETKQAPWRRWVFALASAAALLVVGVVAVRASDESPQHASDIVVAAKKETKDSAGAPVAAAPALQGGEAQAEAPVWDERMAKRGGLDQAASKSARAESALADTSKSPARAPAGKNADLAGSADNFNAVEQPAADAPAKEVVEKKNLVADSKVTASLGEGEATNGRASAAKREQAAANQEELRLDYGNAGRGVALENSKGGKKKPVDNIGDVLNDGTSAKQSLYGGTANGPGFGVSTGSTGLGYEKKKQAEPIAVTTPTARPQVLSPPPEAAPSAPSPVQAPRKSSSYGLPRSAPSQAVDEDSVAVTESVARSGDVETRRLRDQQLNDDAQLAQSRSASNSGDRRGEVMAAVAALNAGAKGYSRLEALKRACDGYEAMGESDRAQPYCERVVAEFGGSAAARQVADRRKAQLKPKSAAPANKYDLESDKREEAKPAEAIHAY